MMPGMPEKRTPDYGRHGTTSFFAAFKTTESTAISSLRRQHRAVEFKKFLTEINHEVAEGLEVHLVCDNYGIHKKPTTCEVAPGLSAVPLAFHDDLLLLAQPGRAILRPRHRRPAPQIGPPQRPAPRRRHPRLAHRLERDPEVIYLNQDRRGDPWIPGTTSTTS